MFVVKWLEGDSKGYDDHLPESCIRKPGLNPLLEHAIVGPRGWIRIGRCSASVHGSSVTFDYEGKHRAWNKEQGFYLGKMKFVFPNDDRLGIPMVLWKDAGKGQKFEAGYGVAELRTETDISTISSDEGDVRLATHLKRERNATLRQEKLLDELTKKGKLQCEVCSADLVKQYGKDGLAGYEVHHHIPISKGKRETYLKDLAILCANCHRVIHSTKPLSSIKTFAKIVRFRQS